MCVMILTLIEFLSVPDFMGQWVTGESFPKTYERQVNSILLSMGTDQLGFGCELSWRVAEKLREIDWGYQHQRASITHALQKRSDNE